MTVPEQVSTVLKKIEIRRILPLKLPPSPFHIETDCAVPKISIPPLPGKPVKLHTLLLKCWILRLPPSRQGLLP